MSFRALIFGTSSRSWVSLGWVLAKWGSDP